VLAASIIKASHITEDKLQISSVTLMTQTWSCWIRWSWQFVHSATESNPGWVTRVWNSLTTRLWTWSLAMKEEHGVWLGLYGNKLARKMGRLAKKKNTSAVLGLFHGLQTDGWKDRDALIGVRRNASEPKNKRKLEITFSTALWSVNFIQKCQDWLNHKGRDGRGIEHAYAIGNTIYNNFSQKIWKEETILEPRRKGQDNIKIKLTVIKFKDTDPTKVETYSGHLWTR
jgi:hypothetical protein